MSRLGTLTNKEASQLNRGFGFAGNAYKVGCRLQAVGLKYTSAVATWEPRIVIGTSSVPITLADYTEHGLELYVTSASADASNSAEAMYVKSVMTGAGGVGGRARFHLYTNVALGGWANALKAYTEFGSSGRITGLASALCAEMLLSAGTTQGTYAPLEVELTVGASGSLGSATSFMYFNLGSDGAATFDTGGYFFHIGVGITAAAGKFCSADYQTLKCLFADGSRTRYMVLSQTENGLGLGASGSAMTTTYDGTKPFSLYTTCASQNGSTSHEPFLVSTTLTGAGQVGGRGRFYSTANVALGGWANALKAHFVYGASGRITGLGSAFCAELELSAGTTQGNYAPIEAELIANAAVSTGTKTAFFYCNIAGSDATGKGTLNSNGYLFTLADGITMGTNDDTAIITTIGADNVATHQVRINANGTDIWLLATTEVPSGG